MINKINLIKYLIILSIVTLSTFYIPNCSIINEHAIYVGLLAASTFAILDRYFPNIVVVTKKEDKYF
jgi:hypothetical protein|tara:strand:- start:438 stop:638 length:201 start_codon:yes stop_codon:yes gene_type:complete